MQVNVVENLIYLVTHGSRAYGLHRPDSDYDVKGVLVVPNNILFGYTTNFEQSINNQDLHNYLSMKDVDSTIYGLQKFMKLAADCNPNIIEVLWVDDDDVLFQETAGKLLRKHRDLFISLKAKYTFSGYAHAQLKRIETHRRWLLHPPEKAPQRADFGLPDHEKQKLVSNDALGTVKKLEEGGHTFSTDLMEAIKKEKRYATALTQWNQYQNWKKTRNPKRAEMEATYGYDCFTDDTEFLTQDGFKLFDDITENDLLATVFTGKTNTTPRHHLGIEYQKPTERFDGIFNGNLYHFKGYHLDICVTPNHRMLIREFSRKNQTHKNEIKFETAANLNDSFQFVTTITPRKTTYNKALEQQKLLPKKFEFINFLRLMGWYLSDGYMAFTQTIKPRPKEIRISQKKHGKLSWHMQRFFGSYKEKISCSIREDLRKPSEFRPYSIIEKSLIISERSIVTYMYDSCGHKENKHIPNWVFYLSKKQMDILLTALCRGDGTERTHKTKSKSLIYYSANKKLADQVQILALMCGYETSLYGPFLKKYKDRNCLMYHVHIRKNNKQFKTYQRKTNIDKIPVKNQRIVCFSVPNGTLITRRNGHIAIQGNCKHAMHLIRLMKMCVEILKGQGVRVNRKGLDADELCAIREGGWSYDRVMGAAKDLEAEADELYELNPAGLPRGANHKKLNELCIEIQETYGK